MQKLPGAGIVTSGVEGHVSFVVVFLVSTPEPTTDMAKERCCSGPRTAMNSSKVARRKPKKAVRKGAAASHCDIAILLFAVAPDMAVPKHE